MSKHAKNLPDDPAELRAMIAALQAENAKISATLQVHDQLVQALRLRIAKLQKLAFGKSSEKIEREIEQLELALEDLLVAVAEGDDVPIDEGRDEPAADDARRNLALWRYDYNNVRPHSSLGNKTPAEACRALEQFEGSAHDALAQNATEDYEIQTRKLSL